MTGDLPVYAADCDPAICAHLSEVHSRAFAEQQSEIWSAESFHDLFSSPGVQVFYAGHVDQIRAFIMVRQVLDEAEVLTLGVEPEMWGQGLAQRVLAHALVQLRLSGVKTVYLEVREDNNRAIKLYIHAGFVKTGQRPAYYQTQCGKHVDALMFVFDLASIDNS